MILDSYCCTSYQNHEKGGGAACTKKCGRISIIPLLSLSSRYEYPCLLYLQWNHNIGLTPQGYPSHTHGLDNKEFITSECCDDIEFHLKLVDLSKVKR